MQCQLHEGPDAPSADYLFTHLETGDSIAMCAECFPSWLTATVEAVATALNGPGPEITPDGEATIETAETEDELAAIAGVDSENIGDEATEDAGAGTE